MDISTYAVKNYQFTLIMVLMALTVGISTMFTMPRAEDPDMKSPQFPVVVIYPGTSPKDMEELVVKPLERRIYALDNIKQIKTSVLDGLAILNVEYRYNSNVEEKYQELVREVDGVRQQLPRDIYSIDVQKVEPSGVNILQVALISENAPRGQLKKAAEDLQDDLEKITSLKDVSISGLPEQLIRVDVLPDRLKQLHIPIAAVMQAVQGEAGNVPAGSVIAGGKSFNIKTSGNYQSIEQIENTIVAGNNGKDILLRHIANVYPDYAQDTHITRLNGHRCLFVTAAQKAGENISHTQDQYLPVIDKFRQALPSNIALVLNFDQAKNVSRRLNGLGEDFLIAVLLVLITLLPLGPRASLVVMIAIPLSLSIGIILINFMGYSLNQLSIVGFVVALGLLVDDSIVVVENTERWMREGYSRQESSLRGTRQITRAVIGCTATLVIAFMPIVFMPEASGDFIRSLPVAVISSVLASMLVALTVVPFLSSRLLKPAENPEGNAVLRIFKRVIHRSYAILLDKALKRPVLTVLIAVCIFGGSLALVPVVGFSLFPSSEKPQFLIDISSPLQANIYYTDSITRQIERKLKTMPEVRYYSSNVGKGNPRIYYNVVQKHEQTDFAEIFVQLDPDIHSDKKAKIMEELRKIWTPYPGAKVEVKDFEQGAPMISPVEVRLFGDNLDTLRTLASRVEQLLKNTKGTMYVNNPVRNNKTDIRVDINRQKALSLGVPTENIDRTVRMAVAGVDLGTYTDPATDDNDFQIRMSVPHSSYPDLSVLDELYVNNLKGNAIPLNQLATLRFETSPSVINHLNKVRTVSVNSFVQAGFRNDQVIQNVVRQMNRLTFPKGYHYEMGGEVENAQRSFGGFGTVILFTVFLFIAVLVLEFRTFKSTLIVLSVIPLGIVGAVLALLVTGNTLSFVASVGMIALAGIEVKNTILLVDFTNQLRREGMDLDTAVEQAGEIRFLPIILTTLTAIGGLLPIALSANPLISPLAIVMIGGLISSTLLSRIVTPVIYKLLPPSLL